MVRSYPNGYIYPILIKDSFTPKPLDYKDWLQITGSKDLTKDLMEVNQGWVLRLATSQ